mgnify:CR=1 FL=1
MAREHPGKIMGNKKVHAVPMENEEEYRVLLNDSPDSVTILDADGRILFLNKASAERFGKSPSQVTNKLIWEFMPKKNTPFTVANLKKVIKTGKGQRINESVNINNALRWHGITLTRMKNYASGTGAVMAISVDTTDLKNAEEKLRESEEKYRVLVEESKNPIFSITPEGRYGYANRSFADAVGLPQESILSKNSRNEYPKREADMRYVALSDAFDTNNTTYNEIRVPTPHGDRYYTVAVVPIMGNNGQKSFTICTAKDVTEHKRAEQEFNEKTEQLRISNEQFMAVNGGLRANTEEMDETAEEPVKPEPGHTSTVILGSAGEGIFSLNPKGIITSVNPAAAKMLGWKESEIVGKDAHGVIHENKRAGVRDSRNKCPLYNAYAKGIAIKHGDGIFSKRDGTSLPVEYVCTPIRERGDYLGSIITFSDVAMRRRFGGLPDKQGDEIEKLVEERTRKLQNQMKKVDELLAIKEEYIGNIAHELKTPLSVIMGNLYLLKDAPSKDAKMANVISVLERNSERINHSINQMLQLSRHSQVEIRNEPVDFKELAENVYKEYTTLAKMKGIALALDAKPVTVIGDKTLLQLALSNLVGNAVKFTNAGSIRMRISAKGNVALFSVSDTGIGMGADIVRKVGEKFFKADPNAPGSGIGISVVNQIAAKHNGSMFIKSALGKGSTFELAIPMGEHE